MSRSGGESRHGLRGLAPLPLVLPSIHRRSRRSRPCKPREHFNEAWTTYEHYSDVATYLIPEGFQRNERCG